MSENKIDHELRDLYLELKGIVEPYWRYDEQMMVIARYIKDNYNHK